MLLSDNWCRSVYEDISRGNKVGRGQSSLGISASGPPEEQNMRFWAMELVVDPASGLLNSERSPFLNDERGTF